MHRYLSLAISFFVVGVIVAVAWLAYLSVAIGEGPQPVMAMQISFPGMYVHWPGLPTQGVTGSMIWIMFLLTTVTNGVIYALIGVGIYSLIKCVLPTPQSSN
jgi:hypothetical protein